MGVAPAEQNRREIHVMGVGRSWRGMVGKAVVQMEGLPSLDTLQAPSYRMEALAVLSGLTFLRVELEWKV